MRKLLATLFIISFFMSLLCMAPASLLDGLAQYYSQGRLVLANCNGTIWNGEGMPAMRLRDGSLLPTQTMHWNISFMPLLHGIVHARLQWGDQPPAEAAELSASRSSVDVEHLHVLLPASLLSETAPILKPAEFHGVLEIYSKHLVLTQNGAEGEAVVDWLHAGSALSSIAPLGDYRLAMDGRGGVISINLSTVRGALVLEGQGSWIGARGLEFQGKAHASAGNEERLGELLHHLGPERSPGVVTFNLRQ